MAKEYCAILILTLILGSVVMQFIRAKKRQKLVKQLTRTKIPNHVQERLSIVDRSFDPFFKDYRKLQIIRKHTVLLAEGYKEDYRSYKIFSRAEILVTTSMLLFCVLAFRVCS